MGKGDKRSKKSKIWRGTFGKARPSNKNKRRQRKAKK
ncbi:MAG: 30S ribosomal protein THX [Bacteroidota bacterium]